MPHEIFRKTLPVCQWVKGLCSRARGGRKTARRHASQSTGVSLQKPDLLYPKPDKVAAEYQVEALVPATGKTYRQTYAGVLVAENGKVKLLHETLDTLAASQAFSKD